MRRVGTEKCYNMCRLCSGSADSGAYAREHGGFLPLWALPFCLEFRASETARRNADARTRPRRRRHRLPSAARSTPARLPGIRARSRAVRVPGASRTPAVLHARRKTARGGCHGAAVVHRRRTLPCRIRRNGRCGGAELRGLDGAQPPRDDCVRARAAQVNAQREDGGRRDALRGGDGDRLPADESQAVDVQRLWRRLHHALRVGFHPDAHRQGPLALRGAVARRGRVLASLVQPPLRRDV